MKNKTISCIYFSPTGTTRKIVEGIASGIGDEGIVSIDLTMPNNGHRQITTIESHLAIIGAPVYGGRIPQLAAERLRAIKGNHVPAVIVAVYGNREYEDALLELRDITIELGFKPVAAGTFIGEHSYHSDAAPIAPGRPDLRDMENAGDFGKAVREKLGKQEPQGRLPVQITAGSLQVPGKFPYREWIPPKEVSPVTDDSSCTLCKSCEFVCPADAINVGETVNTDNSKCILCSACVKKCPAGARVWEADWIRNVQQRLCENYHERKEPEIFL